MPGIVPSLHTSEPVACLWLDQNLSGRLAEIEDQAFAPDGVEQMLQSADEPGLRHEVPGEEAVVEAYCDGIGTGREI